VPDPLLRDEAKKGRLPKLNSHALPQCPVKHRVAGVIGKIGKHNRVFFTENCPAMHEKLKCPGSDNKQETATAATVSKAPPPVEQSQPKAAAASAGAQRANVDAGTRQEVVDAVSQDVKIADANYALALKQYTRVATLASKSFASKQQLDETTAAMSKARSGLDLAQANYAQSKAGPTKEERAVAETNVELADASVAALEAKLDKTTLVAPFDGIVGLLVAEPGEAISAGQPVLTLDVGRAHWFTFTIREDLLAGLTVGSPLQVLTEKGDRVETRVTELRPLGEFAVWRAARAVGDHDVNSFLLRADPVTQVPALESGMTVWIDR